jgi:hypothetical protein
MKVSVYDTYVTKKDNGIMHFDILVSTDMKNIETIHKYGRHFMDSKGQAGQPLTARECQFCHVEEATEKMKNSIEEKGYYIVEMEGC